MKPCPFCGGRADIYEYECEQNIYDSNTLGYIGTEYAIKYGCGCRVCGCIVAEKMSKQTVIEAWNRRVENG